MKASQNQEVKQRTLRDKRDAALTELRRRLSATVAELRVLLDPESALWEAFGLNAPGKRSRKAAAPEIFAMGLAAVEETPVQKAA